MKVGFIGLGNMGLPMARHLLEAGHSLTVYNRTRAKAESLAAKGARIADTPREAAREAEVVFTMVADDRALGEIVSGEQGLLAGMEPKAIHVSLSTISVSASTDLAARHEEAGGFFVAAPVFGRPEAAEAKQLWVLAAGATAAVERCRPLLTALGRGLTVVGDRAPAANVVKLSGNFLIASMIEALSEAFALTRKMGIHPKDFLELYKAVFANSPIFPRYAELIAQEKYEPAGFALRLGLKDLRLVLDAAEHAQAPMPIASFVKDQYLTGVAQGLGDLDWAALGRLAAERAGLEPL